MQVAGLWHYPVKSLQGQSSDQLTLGPDGVEGDRTHGVLDVAAGTILSAKRDGRLLEASATCRRGRLLVTLPSGDPLEPGAHLDEALTAWLGRPARLVSAKAHGVGIFEAQTDDDDASPSVTWKGTTGSFVDESHLHLLTTGDLDQLATERPELGWDVRRFRPNVLVEGGPGALGSRPGTRLLLGGAEAEILNGCTRCVMTTRVQPGEVDRQLEILRHVQDAHRGVVGVRARVVCAGVVRHDDPVELREGSRCSAAPGDAVARAPRGATTAGSLPAEGR
jgi:hypothetical protein